MTQPQSAPTQPGHTPDTARDRPALVLLGAAGALRAGTPLRLPRKSLALIAFIALAGPVTRARVAALFWGDQDQPGARRNLRRELHRLGEVGAIDVIASEGEQLALAAGVTLDVRQFEATLPTDPATALALYRGPLLDGLDLPDTPAFDAWLGIERERLAQLRRGALQAELARHEAAGRPRAALDHALALLADDPLQESHHAQAMRLYYLVGERTRALDLFDRCRRTLRDELGLDPLPATAALAERIRAAEQVAPLAARASTTRLAQTQAPLIGRDAERGEISTATEPLLLVTGEPGVGKTRLVAEALQRLPCLVIRSEPAASGAPLHAVAEALRAALPTADAVDALELSPTARTELARLLPHAADAAPTEAGTPPSPAAQTRFFEGVADALAALTPGGVLWLDDLHWADSATLALLRHLVHRRARPPAGGTQPRIVATARTEELAQHAEATALVRALERGGLARSLPLAPLTGEQTLALVRALSGAATGERFAARLQRATRGNPFYLLETIRFLFDSGELLLDERGQWRTRIDDTGNATADYAELPVPPTVQAAVIERVERLGPAVLRLFETAALAGYPFSLADIQPATALTDWDAADGLERALQAQLLVLGEGSYSFTHDLVRMAIDAAVQPERRRLIHKRLAASLLERRGRADRIAHHLEAGGTPAQAIDWRVRAADEALLRFARTEAMAHLQAALANGAEGERAVEIRIRRVFTRRGLGTSALADNAADFAAIDALLSRLNAPAARYRADLLRTQFLMDTARHGEALRLAIQLADTEAPSPTDAARAHYIACHCATFNRDAPLAVRYGERGRALALTHDAPDLVGLETALTYAYVACDRAAEAVALSDLALARLTRRPMAEPIHRANLLMAAADARLAIGQFASAISMLDEALSLLQNANVGSHIQLSALIARGVVLAQAGDAAGAEQALQRLQAVVNDDTSTRPAFMTAMVAAHVQMAAGRPDDALRELARAIEIAQAASNAAYLSNALTLRARLHEDLGNLPAALADADAAAGTERDPGNPVLVREAMRALDEIARGHGAAARERLTTALASERFVDDHMHESRDFCRLVLAEALLATGDAAGADDLAARDYPTPGLRARALALRVRVCRDAGRSCAGVG